MSLYSVELEKNAIASLLKYPKMYHEISALINEHDFYLSIYKTIFSTISSMLSKDSDINPILVAERLNSMRISFDDDIENIFDFINALSNIQINESAVISIFRELKRVSARRDIYNTAIKIQKLAKDQSSDLSITEIINAADKIYNEKIDFAGLKDEFVQIYDIAESFIEERGNNPVKEFGYMGPFNRVNQMYGSLLRNGNITVLGARSGIGKSTLAQFYLNHVAQQYNVPILSLDFGEMSEHELMARNISMFTGGKVPVYLIETGLWRNNPDMVKMVRAVWPKIKNIKEYYYNIAGKSSSEIISLIRRFYYSHIGRSNPMIINYDYLKPFDTNTHKTPEWAEMGNFMQEIKTLITKEVPCPFWTSLQLNRSGITTNKTLDKVDDSENSFSISDRIMQQSSHSFILRHKLNEEIAEENNQWGNSKLICVKARHLGHDYLAHLNPVRMPGGKFRKNFIHLNINSFHITEMGDLNNSVNAANQLNADSDNPEGLEDII